jgi:hypothetical protein
VSDSNDRHDDHAQFRRASGFGEAGSDDRTGDESMDDHRGGAEEPDAGPVTEGSAVPDGHFFPGRFLDDARHEASPVVEPAPSEHPDGAGGSDGSEDPGRHDESDEDVDAGQPADANGESADDEGHSRADPAVGADASTPQSAADLQPPHTGDAQVDAALAAAAAVRDAEPAEQLETYVGTHRSLQDRLADSGA